MSNGKFNPPYPINEPVLAYDKDSPVRKALLTEYKRMKSQQIDVPMYIGGKEIFTDNKIVMTCPHEHKQVLGHFSEGSKKHVQQAISAALAAKTNWESMPWEQRASIFLKAGELISGPYRAKINAATMLGQGKNVHQAEIDAVCELIDFLRYNVSFMQEIYSQQPESTPDIWNRIEYRALEGFVFAITPFNFTSIAANLALAPALMGNTVIWKPNYTQIFSAKVIMDIFKEAGLPEGVINLIYVDGPVAGEEIFQHPDFAGLHFTGSTQVFKNLWKIIGQNIEKYKGYPRIVGETGGKDFILAHESASPGELAVGLIRGAFEYQGQKCSAASRAYIPANIWDETKKILLEYLKEMKMGPPEDFQNFINAVIDKSSFERITGYIKRSKQNPELTLLAGGNYDDSKGWFIEPTVFVTQDPHTTTMCEEIFGPVLTIYIYEPSHFEETIHLVNTTSPYALTGAIFAKDRYVIEQVSKKLKHAAGNFYINDKPTGAVVGHQPFGGGRASGTNDKAGSAMNLIRWVSPRTIKENFIPSKDYKYPFLD